MKGCWNSFINDEVARMDYAVTVDIGLVVVVACDRARAGRRDVVLETREIHVHVHGHGNTMKIG